MEVSRVDLPNVKDVFVARKKAENLGSWNFEDDFISYLVIETKGSLDFSGQANVPYSYPEFNL